MQHASSCSDLETLEDSVVPPYLSRPKAYSFEKQKRMVEGLMTPRTKARRISLPVGPSLAVTPTPSLIDGLAGEAGGPPPGGVAKWKVQDVDYNAWRHNLIDERTIYNLQEATVQDENDLPPGSRPSTPDPTEHCGVDSQCVLERQYVASKLPDEGAKDHNERRRFSNFIMQEYRKPTRPRSKSPSYGVPAAQELPKKVLDGKPNINSLADLVRELTRPSSSLRIFPKHQAISKCKRPNIISCQFCDVLGPVACHKCIETTNRRIARDVEEAAFEELDCTATTLVAPKLARIMRQGDKFLQRQKAGEEVLPAIAAPGRVSFPSVEAETIGGRHGRAGIERRWEARARCYNEGRGFLPKLRSINASPTPLSKPKPGLTEKQQRIHKLWGKVRYQFSEP